MPKYLIITGGVLSGLGKGIVSSSIAFLLKNQGFKICPIKFDGYLNVDAGTMNPYEHGEVFVLDDGTECDMDLGNYERFLNMNLRNYNNITGGKIFRLIIEKERRGEFLGKTVQMIPHVTNEIKRLIRETGKKENADMVVIEIGGTVGDIENSYFIEAMRQLALEEGKENCFFIHLTLIPALDVVGEQKTKPTQQSVKLLLEAGIQPDMIICRCRERLTEKTKEKISLFCNIDKNAVISDHDVSSIYEIPILLEEQGTVKRILEKFHLRYKGRKLGKLKELLKNLKNPKYEITIGIAGKYTTLHDSYVSIIEALNHCAMHLACKINIRWIETTEIEKGAISAQEALQGIDGLIVPGGFGARGTEGKIKCIEYVRKNKVPFLGLCLGLQLAVVEFARNVCGLNNANSTEINPKTKYPVIDMLPEQKKVKEKGGTMRLGSYPAILKKGSVVWQIYGKKRTISERHRHRFEVNPRYHKILQSKGLIFSGISPDRRLVEFIEIKDHPFFVATQAHPEFKSRIERPSPLFFHFVNACINQRNCKI
ncbi:MAG: CTP synthase (glutamine hydrolyzing) [Candidatus Parvarchaeota archaeon]|nr:CTP synthase (glutamine hydrolyzing) [Candidatus Jingweiarchaeum tengchongense]MCW1298537.1 CTP synthase (glutamine hydrolyzing) [Candidatus Jingweiarchaeum tengchongense]MCW1300217.1 CTP synthase (glutamine hydrolyzing) [Candidatus Jingweiarchaeum tengchongense]MCW1304549.1 CTP synthase (glutamine hydrolyzing) [Candidatus Jingweiarchaeum tengchongense]MCW1305723.1 CTP synthase (glutamine hydrolyzing) [Candidatus Jingweiarchaeum tengchongense]